MDLFRIAARVAAGLVSPLVAEGMKDADTERREDWIANWSVVTKASPEDMVRVIKEISDKDVDVEADDKLATLDDEDIDLLYAKLRDQKDLEPLEVECNTDLDHPCDADVDANGERTGCPSCKASEEEHRREYQRMRPDQHEDMRRQMDPEYAHRRQQEDDDELRDAGRK